MRTLFNASVILLALQGEASAAKLPYYPVVAICGEREARAGLDANLACVRDEQQAYENLRNNDVLPDGRGFIWSVLPDKVTNRCVFETNRNALRNRTELSPYMYLERCVTAAYVVYLYKESDDTGR